MHNYLNPKNAIDGAKLAAAGLCKGWPDLTLHVARGGFNALHIELKKPGNKPKAEQIEVHEVIRAHGGNVIWSDDLEGCKRNIIAYLTLAKK